MNIPLSVLYDFVTSFTYFKGTVCNISGDLLAEMEYNIHNYVFFSV